MIHANRSAALLLTVLCPFYYVATVASHGSEEWPSIKFSSRSPFGNQSTADAALFRELVGHLSPNAQGCGKNRNIRGKEVFEICNRQDITSFRLLVSRWAPTLPLEELRFWSVDLDADGGREILIGLRAQDPNQDPWLVLWAVSWNADRYLASYAGSFLDGSVHAAQPFGKQSNDRKLFVLSLSCTECCPWVYLTVLDFSAIPEVRTFEFTYTDDHATFDSTIEYELPGHGHSVDATVETRIPTEHTVNGPHLIQHFSLDTGGHEWWVFRCTERKCDYAFYESLPKEYVSLWKRAARL